MLNEWVLSRLEPLSEDRGVIVRDPLHLLPEANGTLHSFAQEHGFTVIAASTNLAFRQLYELATKGGVPEKLLIFDRTPLRRRKAKSLSKAPPAFYPDVLASTRKEAVVDLDLRQYLKERTGDPGWPAEANDPQYARLIVKDLGAVLRAHNNLRTAHPGRFTDADFETIVAFAALGIADSAFKKLGHEDYWKIGLVGYGALDDLERLAPAITNPIRAQLRKAPAPFCHLADNDPALVIHAFYLLVILAQHTPQYKLLIANIDPAMKGFADVDKNVLEEAAPKLISMDLRQAKEDISAVERLLSRDALALVLLDQLELTKPESFAAAVEQEGFSCLLRSLSLLLALDDLLSPEPALGVHKRVHSALFPEHDSRSASFVDAHPSISLSDLKDAYGLATRILALRDELKAANKQLKVTKTDQLTFALFLDFWNAKQVNRLEYLVSSLERHVFSADFLPRPELELPPVFGTALERIRHRVRELADSIADQTDEVNRRFQEMVAAQYPSWILKEGKVTLTSQFIRRCLRPHWDPKKEKAAVFVFDGMRYDIWDELLRPLLDERMDILTEMPASSLLPSETHVTRKAISAGAYPDEFNMRSKESTLLKAALKREMDYDVAVEEVAPEGAGTGETVRYSAGNLDVYIFELCDKELHKIPVKKHVGGRNAPARPLAFIYDQHLKNIIDIEVMSIVRKLPAGTKVFVIADHGFALVGRDATPIPKAWLNESYDCCYLHASLRENLENLPGPRKTKETVWEFPVSDLRMPSTEVVTDPKTKKKWKKQFASVVFPKVGFALKRPNAPFNPDAYTHGGMSIQELLIPMVALRVRDKDEDQLLGLSSISCPNEVLEGQELEFTLHATRTGASAKLGKEMRVDVDVSYAHDAGKHSLPSQVCYVPVTGTDITSRFVPNAGDATDEERKNGLMERTLIVTVSFHEGNRLHRKSQTHKFSVKLNSERVIRRVPPQLGNILGLTPKGIR